MIRSTVLELFKSSGKPVPLDQVAKKLGISFDEFSRRLMHEQRLSNLGVVDIEEAQELISFYGRDAIFTDDLVNKIEQYLASRKKIEGHEKRARDAGLLPPDEKSR